MKLAKIFILGVCMLGGNALFAQQITCDSITEVASSYLNTDRDKSLNKVFISDGQVYRAFLDEEQTAEFDVTLYGGSTYRIAASAGTDDNYLVYRIYDTEKERNLLFTNYDYGNAPYWDFKVESTINCTIEVELDLNKKLSGCAVMMIGFEKKK